MRTLPNPEVGEGFRLFLDFIEPGITSRFDGSLERRQGALVNC
jgi:hypothetical protein